MNLPENVSKRGLFLAVVLGLCFGAVSIAFLAWEQAALVAVVVFLITLWCNQALPMGVVSLLPLVLFPSLTIESFNLVAVNYSKPVIFLFLGGFMLALGVEQTGLHKVIARKMLLIFPSTSRGMLFALATTSGVMSSFLSNTSTALLLLPLGLCLTEDKKLQGRFALAIAYGASIGGIITPIGTPPNLIYYGFMEANNLKPPGFVEWISMVAPLAALMMLICGFLLGAGIKNEQLGEVESAEKMSRQQWKMACWLIALAVLLILNAPIGSFPGLGLNEKVLLLGFGLALFFPGMEILKWEHTKKIPYEIIFLFGAGFAMAAAFESTGLADVLASSLVGIGKLSPFIVILSVAFLVTFASEVTGNTALISLMLPVLFSVTSTAGLDTAVVLMVATVCSSYAFMLPIATPPNAIAMSSGAVTTLDMVKKGFLLNLFGVLLISLVAYFFW